MPFKDPVVAGNRLVRTAIQSTDYVAGVSGWRIARDGTAEFNNVTVRGSFSAGSSPGQVVQATVNGLFVFYDDLTSQPGYIQLTSASSGQYLELRMLPLPSSGTKLINVGGLQSIVGNNGGDRSGYLLLYTPSHSGCRTAYIELYAESETLSNGPKMNVVADTINLVGAVTASSTLAVTGNVTAGPNAGDLGRGIVAGQHAQTVSAAIGTTETAVLTTGTTTFKAGRIYRVDVEGSINTTAAPLTTNHPQIRIRKTDASGQQLAVSRVSLGDASNTHNANYGCHFKVLTTDVTCELCFTLVAPGGAYTVQHSGSATGARGMTVYDVGSTSAPGMTNVVTLT